MILTIVKLTLFMFSLLSLNAMADRPRMEVLHFWKQKSEQRALDVFKDEYMKQGGVLVYTISASSGESRRKALERMVSGFPPAAIQWHANRTSLQDLAENDLLLSLNDISKKNKWDEKIPKIIRDALVIEGRLLAVPTNLHGENWVWYNKRILDRLKLSIPNTWQDFFSNADAIKRAGYLPVAIGTEPWQLRIMFNAILLSIDRQAYIDLAVMPSEKTMSTTSMKKAMSIYTKLRSYGSNAKVKSWSDAAGQIIEDKAAVQFMGGWVYGELSSKGMQYGRDFECHLAPETGEAYAILADIFIFPKTYVKEIEHEQKNIAEIIFREDIQHNFSAHKGSVPANLFAPVDDLNPCAKKALLMMKKTENQVPSHRLVAGEIFNNIFDGALAKIWFDSSISKDEGLKIIIDEVKSTL